MNPSNKRREKFRFWGPLLGLAAALTVFLLFLIPGLELLELSTLDYRFQNRPNHKVNPAVFLIAIDDISLEKVGHWPWPRSYHAQLVDVLGKAGARVIGFDVIFAEKDEPAEDLAFQRAIAGNGRVHLPFYFREVTFAGRSAAKGENPVWPIRPLKDAAAGKWPINTPRDRDGVTRSIPLVFEFNGRLYPSLGLALSLAYLEIPPENIRLLPGRLEISGPRNEKILVPVDRQGRMLINYAGDSSVFRACPWETALLSGLAESAAQGKIRLEDFKDKIVLIGSTATGIGDLWPTPVNPLFPMFVVHANVINNILQRDFLIRPNPWIRFFLLILLGLLAGLILEREKLLWQLLATVVLLAVYVFLTLNLFSRNVWLDLVSPPAVIILTFLIGTVQHFLSERLEKNFIRATFQRYVAPEVAAEILSRRSAVKLGGDRRRVTVLFADLRGFTALSESLPPEQVVKLLNEMLSLMVNAIFKYNGTLDKFIGDCVMAIFGAPLEQPDQELMAVRTALEIKSRLAAEAEKWSRDLDGAVIRVGIGINTGEAIVGNIGSLKRMDYTAIGDTVNLAERLESLAREGQIFVSEAVWQAVAASVEGRVQPAAVIKGKREPVVFYEISGLK